MLLYLTSNEKSRLIDEVVQEKEITAKKLIGKFSLCSFVTKDMRNYATSNYFIVDDSCVDEQLGDFVVALQSFQMMFSARIIVILSGCENTDGYIDRLVSIGVINIVTADTPEGVSGELIECLSDEGMQKYIPQDETAKLPLQPEPDSKVELGEIVPYKWNAKNIKIAVAGTQRRSGVTVMAFNMAEWLKARGADVCYMEMNTARSLQMLLNIYDAERMGEHYSLDGLDCYLTNEPDRDYHFIICDCGEIQMPSTVFKEAEIRLLCGSILPYEIPAFHKAVQACGSIKITKIGLCVPQEFQEYCVSLFEGDIQIADASHDLFANNVNGHIYRLLVQAYIMRVKRL